MENNVVEMSLKETKFLELLKLNVNDKIEKRKNGNTELSYLSWSYAVVEFTKAYPDFKYEIKMFDGKPYSYDEKTGYMVFTSITADGQTKDMWLPVMDGANKAMKSEPYTYKTKYDEKTVAAATMFDINKTIMRCLVKNMAMFGLGLYIYNGEDLPEQEQKQEQKQEKKLVSMINADQINKIIDLDIDIDKLCTYYKVATIDELTFDQANYVITKKSKGKK